MRFSRQRQVILGIVRGTMGHPDADWIYKEARRVMPNISLGTVYRNLKFLMGEGNVIGLEVRDGVLRYDGDTSDHAHFCCNTCGEITDIILAKLPLAEVEQKGYTVETAKLMCYGTCPKCSASKE